MTRALLAFVLACSAEKPENVPPPPAPMPFTRVVGCALAESAPADPRAALATTAQDANRRRVPPVVLVQTPSVAGDLDATIVRTILRRHVTKFLSCFETQLAAQPDLAGGTLEASFAVQPTGFVASPHVDGVHPEVAKCVASALTAVAFPAPVDRNQVQVTAHLEIVHAVPAAAPFVTPRPERPLREWTPFAIAAGATDDAATVVEAATRAMEERLRAVERCYDGATGTLRAMLELDAKGTLASLRTGGIGDVTIENCAAKALADVSVQTERPIELACDFARGGDSPLRVSPDAGYIVIDATRTRVSWRSFSFEVLSRAAERPSPLGPTRAALITAEPDAPAHVIDFALAWVQGPTLVAVKAAGGAPVFVGMGDRNASRQAASDKRVVQLRTDGGRLRACIAGDPLDETAPLLDARAMNRVLETVAAACRRTPCEPTVVVGTSGELVAKDLVATTSAARRAGMHVLSIGGAACER